MDQTDRIMPLTRVTFIPLALLSALFGPLLFLFPNQTEIYFSWTITPGMSAVFIGTGYTSGALIIFWLMRLGQWHPMRPFALGGWGFIVAIFGATLLHWDKFHHGTVFFYIWLVVYAVGPFLVPLAFWRNERLNSAPEEGTLLLQRFLRAGLVGAGLIFTLIGILLFINPALFMPIWPWQLSPLIARVVAAWIFLPGLGALGAIYEPRYTAYRPLIQFSFVWAGLMLVGSALHVDDFDFSRPLAWLWFAYLLFIIPVGSLVYRYYEGQLNSSSGEKGQLRGRHHPAEGLSIILILVFIGLSACQGAEQALPDDPAAVMDAYTAAINSHDLDAALALVAEDAVYERPNGRYDGKAEIQTFIEELFARDVQVELVGERLVNGEEVSWISSVSIKDADNPDGPLLQLTNNSRSIVRNGLIVYHTAERAQSEAARGVLVGKVAGSDAFIALVSDGSDLVAYVCDGKDIAEWFRGGVGDTVLTAGSGAALTLTMTVESAAGLFTPVNGVALDFVAETAVSPAGLYRAEETVDNASYVGGWIVLADGQQRGAIKNSVGVIAAPFMDPENDLVVSVPNIGSFTTQFMDPEIDL